MLLNICSKQSRLVTNVIRNIQVQQSRNTFILKRRFPPPLHKKGGKHAKMKGRHFIYDMVEHEGSKAMPDTKVVLKEFVEGVGNAGDVISTRPMMAYKNFLLPGLATYATPENIEKYTIGTQEIIKDAVYSSPYAPKTIETLSKLVLQITMSKNTPWTLERWHVKASFRKSGIVVPESAIELPSTPISGPDLSLQEKEFYVTVTINNKEKANVRCRIHHWALGVERLPWLENHWKEPRQPLFPEQAEVLASLPLP